MVERDAKVAKRTVAVEAKLPAISDGPNPVLDDSASVERVAGKRKPADEVAPSGGRVGKAAKADPVATPAGAPWEKRKAGGLDSPWSFRAHGVYSKTGASSPAAPTLIVGVVGGSPPPPNSIPTIHRLQVQMHSRQLRKTYM